MALVKNGSLTATVVASETGFANRRVQVINHTGADTIYFTVNGETPTTSDTADTYKVPATVGALSPTHGVGGDGTVRLISDSAGDYSVVVV